MSIHSYNKPRYRPLQMIMIENECSRLDILLHCTSVCRWLPLVVCIQRIPLCSPIIGSTPYRKIQKFQKGEPFSTGGGYITLNPRYIYVQTIDNTMLHTPVQTIVYTNGTYFCFIHNHHKHRLYLYVLKPYISIHMYYAIEYTIVIYNRLLQLRNIYYIHNPLYV